MKPRPSARRRPDPGYFLDDIYINDDGEPQERWAEDGTMLVWDGLSSEDEGMLSFEEVGQLNSKICPKQSGQSVSDQSGSDEPVVNGANKAKKMPQGADGSGRFTFKEMEDGTIEFGA